MKINRHHINLISHLSNLRILNQPWHDRNIGDSLQALKHLNSIKEKAELFLEKKVSKIHVHTEEFTVSNPTETVNLFNSLLLRL